MKNIKKILSVGALALTIGVGSLVAYADSPDPTPLPSNRNENFTIEEREEFREERHAIKREELKKALENKEITEEEAKEWEEHFKYMEEFQEKHRENNIFSGKGFGKGMRGQGRGCNGMGMMRGNRAEN